MVSQVAAVSCSSNTLWLGGVKIGFWLTGQLGRAWHRSWVVHGLGAQSWLVGRGSGLFVVLTCDVINV